MFADAIFHEMYGVYFKAIAEIINKSLQQNISFHDAEEIIRKTAYAESPWLLMKNIRRDEYSPIIDSNLKTLLHNTVDVPLTTLEKRWIKSVLSDERIKLFGIETHAFDDVESLFTASDIYVCGQYEKGDDFSSTEYIEMFKIIRMALREGYTLKVEYISGHKRMLSGIIIPQYLQYSIKEDKFRLFAIYEDELISFNLSRILSCQLADPKSGDYQVIKQEQSYVDVLLRNERLALERFLLSFANYRRNTQKVDDNLFKIRVTFPKKDSMEVLVNILSFTPMAQIIAPVKMVERYQARIQRQRELFMENSNS